MDYGGLIRAHIINHTSTCKEEVVGTILFFLSFMGSLSELGRAWVAQ